MRISLAHALVTMLAISDAIAGDEITGFVAGGGELSGQVTSSDGKPVANVTVHVVSTGGVEKTITTDKQGRYKAAVSNEGAYVFVHGKVRIGGHVAVDAGTPGAETVEIRETLSPVVMPKPITNPATIPEYSDAMADRDFWARAWLMLDISDTGEVTQVKLINKPGLDLDPIAIRDAFKLRFEPARDRSNRPIRALMLWTFEWPSFRWLEERDLPIDRLPSIVARVPCKPKPSPRSHYRDCSRPNMADAFSQPWLAKPQSKKSPKK